MKNYTHLGIFFICTALLVGCTSERIETIEVSSEIAYERNMSIELYVEETVDAALYEPEKGVYLGAYVEKNVDLDQDITNLEDILEQKQAFRVFQYSADKKITQKEILECIANKKIPYIKMMATSEKEMVPLYQMIGDLYNTYNTPIFIELFPVTANEKDPAGYKAYYTNGYHLIKRYLKNAVVVWSVDGDRVFDASLYYPGADVVDWAGINIYLPKYKDNKRYEPDVISAFDYWYKTFQGNHPMMISALAVSHFSRVDHAYSIEEAKNKLSIFYENLVFNYPRLKGILYVDVDMKQVRSTGMEDYRISSQTGLVNYMKNTIQNSLFLQEVEEAPSDTLVQYMKYTVPALSYDDKIYIEKEYAKSLFGKSEVSKVYTVEDIDGKRYCDAKALLQKRNGYYMQ